MDNVQHAFDSLGLPADASLKEVRQAYRNLVRSWHPDRFSHDPLLQQQAQERLKEINAAYNLARRNIAITKIDVAGEAAVPDSPFRFTAPVITPVSAPATDSASHRPAPSAPSISPGTAVTASRPLVLNIVLFILGFGCLTFSMRKYGMSFPGWVYFFGIMAIPLLCAFICNLPVGTSRSLRRGYLASLLLFGTVVAIDAVNLKRGGGQEAVYPIHDYAGDEGGTGSRGGAMMLAPGTRLEEPAERVSPDGPEDPSVPHAPTAPIAPAPSPPSSPVVPHTR